MKFFTLLAVTSLIATPALAADAIIQTEVAPARADTFSWTGGYIGLNAGYAGGRTKADTAVNSVPVVVNFARANNVITSSLNNSANGFVGGIQAGYNWQIDKFIYGLETDIQAAGIESKFIDSDFTEVSTKIDWFGTTRVRLGYTPVDRFMIYATGGLAYGKIKYEMWNGNVSASDTRVGYTVGAGAEYAITQNISLRTEYLYTDLGKLKFDNVGTKNSTSGEVKLPFHTVRIGVNYKF